MVTWWRELLGRSLRLRLTATLSAGLGLLLSLLFAGLDWSADRALYGELNAGLAKQAHAILAVLQSSSPDAMRDPMNALMPEFRRDINSDFFQIRDADGRTISKSDSCAEEDLPAPPPFDDEGPVYYTLTLRNGLEGRAAALRSHVDSLPARYRQPVTVVVAEDTSSLEGLETQAHYLLASALVLSLVLSSLLAGFAVRRGLRPLEAVGERAALLTAAPQPAAAPATAAATPMPLELEPVVRSLDSAFARLLAAVERERRFARTVAHELRTPLAEVRASAELALRQDPTAAVRRELDDILATTDDMARALDALLALAAYEAGLARAEPEPLDLRALVQRLVAQHEARARQRDLRWDLALPPTVWVSSHPTLLARILANLLQNAADYAPPHSVIAVFLGAEDDTLVLHVRNDAGDFDAAQLRHLGEAHWRRDPTLEPERHGGLGLALARAIAAVLELRIEFSLGDGRLDASVHGLACVAVVGSAPPPAAS